MPEHCVPPCLAHISLLQERLMMVFVLWIYPEGSEFLPQEHRMCGLGGKAAHTKKGVPRSVHTAGVC